VTIEGATAAGLNVSVSYGAMSCVRANPAVTISPLNPTVQAGSSVNYTVSVTNQDSSGCSASLFDMNSLLPSGWSTSFSSSILSLNPGQSQSVTMTKTVAAGTAIGTYAVNASATNGQFSATAAANCTVATLPTVTVSVPDSTYPSRSTVEIMATVASGSNAAVGASVSFMLTKPDGTTASRTLTTDSNGRAVWSYRFARKDLSGIYQVRANAIYNSLAGSSDSITFEMLDDSNQSPSPGGGRGKR